MQYGIDDRGRRRADVPDDREHPLLLDELLHRRPGARRARTRRPPRRAGACARGCRPPRSPPRRPSRARPASSRPSSRFAPVNGDAIPKTISVAATPRGAGARREHLVDRPGPPSSPRARSVRSDDRAHRRAARRPPMTSATRAVTERRPAAVRAAPRGFGVRSGWGVAGQGHVSPRRHGPSPCARLAGNSCAIPDARTTFAGGIVRLAFRRRRGPAVAPQVRWNRAIAPRAAASCGRSAA